jgi:hypothetical protein
MKNYYLIILALLLSLLDMVLVVLVRCWVRLLLRRLVILRLLPSVQQIVEPRMFWKGKSLRLRFNCLCYIGTPWRGAIWCAGF